MKTSLHPTLLRPHSVAALLLIILSLLHVSGPLASASTVAYWRFEEGPADANVMHGGQPDGVFFPGTADSSGNGNALSVWAEGWGGFAYRADVPMGFVPATGAANNFSVQNTGGYPVLFTDTSSDIGSIQPIAFTIEASFKPENGGYRTLVGRDSLGASPSDPNLSALYLQIQPDNSVAIKFCDVFGYWHEAISAPGIIEGFDWPTDPNGLTGHWYHLAAVSDGGTLSLYLNSGSGYMLVAQIDLSLSGSPIPALTAGAGDGGDWNAGDWTVGRGLYAGGHCDRAFGFIDEVRISDSALAPEEFLFWWAPIEVTSAADGGPGTLREALAGAANGDTITFLSSLSGATILLTSGPLDITNSVSIVGPGAGLLTVSGNNTSRVFTVTGPNVTISKLTIANGASGTLDGAGIRSGGNVLSVSDCVLTNNSSAGAYGGGGIFNSPGVTLTVSNCMFFDNSAASGSLGGGGIHNDQATLHVVDCAFTGNSARDGGGIYNYFGTLSINHSTLGGNSASRDGGGIFQRSGVPLTVSNCTLSANSAIGSAGGIFNNNSTVTVTASSLTGNTANLGGAIFNEGASPSGTLEIIASTLNNNSANYGSAIYTGSGGSGDAVVTITNSTLSDNDSVHESINNDSYWGGTATLRINACTLSRQSGTGIFNDGGTLEIGGTILNDAPTASGANIANRNGTVASDGYNLCSDDGGGFLTNAMDKISTGPKLGPLQDNGGPTWTHALLPGSPAIDAGDDSMLALLPTDQRGLPRKFGPHVDIGAYESQLPNILPPLLAGPSRLGGGAMQFNFTNAPGALFTVLTATNLTLPMDSWSALSNPVVESPPGFYQVTDPSATNDAQRFYRLRWP